MAMEHHDRAVPRVLEKDRSTPDRPEGISWAGFAFLAFIVAAAGFLGYSVYSVSPPSAPAADRQTVNPPITTR